MCALDLRQGLPPVMPWGVQQIAGPGTTTGAPFGKLFISPDGESVVTTSGSNAANNYRFCLDIRKWLSGLPEGSVWDTPGLAFGTTTRACGISNNHYAIGGDGGSLYVFARADSSFISVTATGIGNIDSIKFSPDGQLMAVLHRTSPYLRIYNTTDWSFVNASAAASTEGTAANNYDRMDFSADGAKIVVCGDSNPHHTVFDAITGTRLVATNSTAWAGNCLVAHPTNPDIFYRAAGGSSSAAVIAKIDLASNSQSATAAPGSPDNHVFAMAIDPEELILYYSRSASVSVDGWATYVCALDLVNDVLVPAPLLTTRFSSNPESLAITNIDRHRISGTVRDVDNNPAARVVRAYRRSSGELMAQTISDAVTGDYELRVPDAGPYDVQFMIENGELLNDLFFARSEPEPI